MSRCISSRGEYSEHAFPPPESARGEDRFTCTLCGVFDEWEALDALAHMTEARDNARAEVERLTALIAEVRDAMEDESNLDGWVGNYVRTSTIRRILDGAGSTT